MNEPKVTDLQADLKKASDAKAGSGGISKLKDDIDAAATIADVKKILKKIVKITVNQ